MSEYQWFAMDSIDAVMSVRRPTWAGDCFFAFGPSVAIAHPPTFLKPGQLWERHPEAHPHGEYLWDGYWWRKVEDYGENGGGDDEVF